MIEFTPGEDGYALPDFGAHYFFPPGSVTYEGCVDRGDGVYDVMFTFHPPEPFWARYVSDDHDASGDAIAADDADRGV